MLPIHISDEATLIDLADAALYRAKARGRDQIRVTGEMTNAKRDRVTNAIPLCIVVTLPVLLPP